MSSSAPNILGLDHLVLRVSDVARAVRFYTGVLGLNVERVREDLGLTQMRAGHTLIDLVSLDGPLGRQGGAAPGVEARNMDHYCLRIEPFDVAALTAHLIVHGVVPGEVRERYGADGYGPSMYIEDPDGNTVELKGPPVRAAR